MTLEEKIQYLENIYETDGLPNNISYQEYFDIGMLNFMNTCNILYLSGQDWIELYKVYKNNQLYIDILTEIICTKSITINQNEFNTIMSDQVLLEQFLLSFIKLTKSQKVIKGSILNKILNSPTLRLAIIENQEIEPNIFEQIIKITNLSKETLVDIINNERYIDMIYNFNTKDFFSLIIRYNLEEELRDIIDTKIRSLSYEEQIKLVSNTYKPDTNQPEFLKDLYLQHKERIDLNNKRNAITSLNQHTSSEEKELIRAYLTTKEGKELFLREVIEPQFAYIINELNLEHSLYQERKDILLNELHNYTKYDLSTVKDILCSYCFGDNAYNTTLRIKTLLEYARENKEAYLLLKDNLRYLISLYNYLTTNNEINPLELITDLNIEDLINKSHTLFQKQVNNKTNITNILNSSTYIDKDGVKIIDTDIPLEQSYFLIHSVSQNDIQNNPLESYLKASREHNRICTSILDDAHTKTFSNGVIFGYCNIEAPIYSAVPFDGQTNQRVSGILSKGKPQYRSILGNIDSFMDKTVSKYNELTYMTNNEPIMPSYIFVPNREPNELELKIAKEFNIPILIYRSKNIKKNIEQEPIQPEFFDYSSLSINYVPKQTFNDDITLT